MRIGGVSTSSESSHILAGSRRTSRLYTPAKPRLHGSVHAGGDGQIPADQPAHGTAGAVDDPQRPLAVDRLVAAEAGHRALDHEVLVHVLPGAVEDLHR